MKKNESVKHKKRFIQNKLNKPLVVSECVEPLTSLNSVAKLVLLLLNRG